MTFEQREPQAPPDFDPAPPSAVLGSRLVTADLSPGFDSGWAVLAFDGFGNGDLAGSDGEIAVVGQPVTGFLAAKFVNGAVDGKLANYSFASPHGTYVPRRTNPLDE